MNYNYIECLVKEAKNGDEYSKVRLTQEFKPYIINLANRTYIQGYEFEDIVNECYRILFNCVKLYNCDTHRFVGYATNGIRNSINYLITKSMDTININGPRAMVIDDNLEFHIEAESSNIEEIFLNNFTKSSLIDAISKLESDEQEMLYVVYFKKIPLKRFCTLKGLCYSKKRRERNMILEKLRKAMKRYDINIYDFLDK